MSWKVVIRIPIDAALYPWMESYLTDTGWFGKGQKSRNNTNFGRQMAVATKFCAVAHELASSASDFEVDPIFLENMYTPDQSVYLP